MLFTIAIFVDIFSIGLSGHVAYEGKSKGNVYVVAKWNTKRTILGAHPIRKSVCSRNEFMVTNSDGVYRFLPKLSLEGGLFLDESTDIVFYFSGRDDQVSTVAHLKGVSGILPYSTLPTVRLKSVQNDRSYFRALVYLSNFTCDDIQGDQIKLRLAKVVFEEAKISLKNTNQRQKEIKEICDFAGLVSGLRLRTATGMPESPSIFNAEDETCSIDHPAWS